MDKNTKLYSDLFSKYVKAHAPVKSKSVCQIEVNEKWKRMKNDLHKDMSVYNELMGLLDEKIKKKGKGSIMSLFKKQSKINKVVVERSNNNETVSNKPGADTHSVVDSRSEEELLVLENETVPVVVEEMLKRRPVQEKLKEEIDDKRGQLERLEEAKNSGLNNDAHIEKRKVKVVKEKKVLVKRLRKIEKDRKANAKLRAVRKEVEEKLKRDNPELAASLHMREGVGRPSIECDLPDLGETLLRIATIGAAASDKRRDEILRSVKTLDDLKEALHTLGFSVKRSTLYLRLQPRNQTTREGKLHVSSVPVRLTRPQNNLRKKHPDR